MAVFVIFRVADAAKMTAALKAHFPDDHLDIGHTEWLVSSKGTAKEISDKLGVSDGSGAGNAIIVRIGSYYGRAATNIWDWIKSKSEATDG